MENGNSNGKEPAKPLLEDYLTEEQAAKRIGISRITLFRERKRAGGRVPHFKIGGRIFYDENCIKQYLENSRRVT
jgi:predicted DNA-binding protein (UPF0251 family)